MNSTSILKPVPKLVSTAKIVTFLITINKSNTTALNIWRMKSKISNSVSKERNSIKKISAFSVQMDTVYTLREEKPFGRGSMASFSVIPARHQILISINASGDVSSNVILIFVTNACTKPYLPQTWTIIWQVPALQVSLNPTFDFSIWITHEI